MPARLRLNLLNRIDDVIEHFREARGGRRLDDVTNDRGEPQPQHAAPIAEQTPVQTAAALHD